MLTVSQLREKLQSIPELYRSTSGHECKEPNEIAIGNAAKILDQMEKIHLEATYLMFTADDGIGIVWKSTFTPGRYCHMECLNDGGVCGVRCDYELEDKDPNFFQFWWVHDLSTDLGEGELKLSLAEALEHIRCYIWADYK